MTLGDLEGGYWVLATAGRKKEGRAKNYLGGVLIAAPPSLP